MSAEDYIICPHCGKENLIQASRCIYCKESLDLIPKDAAELAASEEDLSEMLSTMAAQEGSAEMALPTESVSSLMPGTVNPQTVPNEESSPSDELPAWLAHVRQRAQTEGDAQGLYNRDSVAPAGQKQAGRENPDQPFNSWVGRIHENQSSQDSLEEPAREEKADEMPVWLKRVRDLQLQPEENAVQKPSGVDVWKQEWSEEDLERLKNGEFDEKIELQPSLLTQATGVQDVLQEPAEQAAPADQKLAEAEASTEAVEGETAEEESSSSSDDELSGASGELVEIPAVGKPVAQAEILKEIVDTETQPQFKRSSEKPRKTDIWRWIGILFLLAMLTAFYLLFLKRPAPAPLGSAAGTAFWNRIDSVQTGAKVLIILDYQVATADELHANLQPVMDGLKTKKAQLSLVALWPDGIWLGRELLEETNLAQASEVNFLPGGSLAMLAGVAGFRPAGYSEADQAGLISSRLALGENELILYVTDNSESTRTWIEQVATFLRPEQNLLVSTQASQVMLQPYYESSQVAGLSSSPYRADGSLLSGAVPAAASPAFEAGMGLMALFLALSFISKMIVSSKKHAEGDGKF